MEFLGVQLYAPLAFGEYGSGKGLETLLSSCLKDLWLFSKSLHTFQGRIKEVVKDV